MRTPRILLVLLGLAVGGVAAVHAADGGDGAGAPDHTPPALAVPGDISIRANAGNGAVVNYRVSAIDDSDAGVSLRCTPASGSVFPLGRTAVQCAARDRAGNHSVAGFTVAVRQGRWGALAALVEPRSRRDEQ